MSATTAPAPVFAVTEGDGIVITDFASVERAYSVALQADGKIVVSGISTNVSSDIALARYNVDGTLDTSFSGDGKVTTDILGNDSGNSVIVQQADGGIVVAGVTNNGSNADFAVVRYNADGSLDTSFGGGDGIVTTEFGRQDSARYVMLDVNSKILVAGDVGSDSTNWTYALARYTTAGVLDTTFSGDGRLNDTFSGANKYNFGSSVTVQTDGKMLIAGTTGNTLTTLNFAIARYTTAGVLDTTFNGTGKLITDFSVSSGADMATSVIVQDDNKILVSGFGSNGTDADFMVARYSSTGVLDATFGTSGKATIDFGGKEYAWSMVQQADGKVLVGGYNDVVGALDDFVLVRLNTNGTLDNTFGGTGMVTIDISADVDYSTVFTDRCSIVVQDDGKILIAGADSDNFVVARLNADGTLDNSFDVATTLNGGETFTEHGSAVVLDSTVNIFDPQLAALNGGLGNYGGASVILQREGGANAEDVFSESGNLDFQGTGSGNVLLSATTIGTYTQSGGTLTITFNSNATQTVVNEVLSSIAYANNSDVPPTSVQIDWTFSDGDVGGAHTTVGSTTVAITAVNDGPLFNLEGIYSLGGTANYTENSAPIILDSTVGIYDIELIASETQSYNGASVTLARQGGANAQDVFSSGSVNLTIETEGGSVIQDGWVIASVTVNGGGTLTITFNEFATQELVNAALSSIAYNNTSDAPGVSVIIDWTVNDGNTAGAQGTGGALTEVGNTTINITQQNDSLTGDVTISGTATQGETLTANNTLADADGLGTLHYQWQADGFNIGTDSSTFVLTETEVGKTVTVTVSYTDGGGTLESVSSAATAVVANVNDLPTGNVTIDGIVEQNATLTANTSTLSDADVLGTLHYQWQADGSNIGTDSSTVVLSETEVGKTITVAVSYVDGHGTAESKISNATAAVANVNDLPTGNVTIDGTVEQNATLTANTSTLADVDGLGTLHYQWQADGSNIGADSNTVVLSETEVGKIITVAVSYVDGHGTAESKTSNATAAVANVNDLPTGDVTITGTTTQGETLTANNTLADIDGLGTLHYQWQADGSNIGTDSNTLVLPEAAVGKTVTVAVSYTDGHGTLESVSSAATAIVANVNDLPTGDVTIDGSLVVGQTLTANTSALFDADGLGTLHYQWQADGSNIGTDTSTVVLSETEVGKTITVAVSYVDGHGTAELVNVGPTPAVIENNSLPTGDVTITGTTTQGETLTANNTLADIDGLGTLHYQWQADGSNIGTDSSTLVLPEAAVGKTITVAVSYVDGHGTAESKISNATAVVANVNDLPTGNVTIDGIVEQNATLTANTSTLADADGLGTLHYQWQADGSNIGTDTSTVVLSETEVGKTITVAVSYVDGHGTAESKTSNATAAVANVNDLPTGNVTITGTTTQGETLTANNTLADIDGLGTLHYQWQADGSNIGADSSTLVLTEAAVGKTVTVAVSYTDGHGTLESVSSAATAIVINVNDLPTGNVTIDGTVEQNATLTANTSTLADADGLGTLHYQWQADGSNIGTDSSTVMLTETEVGKIITVAVSYVDGHGTVESKTSNATAAVVNVNDLPTGNVTIDGTVEQNATLTANTSTLADADGLGTLHYQWQADGSNIGTDSSTLVLTEAAVGKIITVAVSYVDGHGTAESQTSNATAAVANVNDLPTGNVTITGTTTQDETLTANNTLADIDGLGTLHYQWQADGSNIGTDSSTLVLTETEVGKVITVAVSYTDGHGTLESVSSAPTPVVNGLNTIIGTDAAETLTGTSLSDVINGLGGNDTLNGLGGNDHLIGGLGSDTMVGGLGDDTYHVDVLTDVVTEAASAGTDEVITGLTYTLGTNVENLTLTGSVDVNGTGNTLANTLTGNDGDNVLNGMAGLDTYAGGEGNDTYVLDQEGELATVTEVDGEGTADQITIAYANTSKTVPKLVSLTGALAEIENLTVTGTGLFNLTGNAEDNVLMGNTSVNTLTGGAGDDTLNGGAGADTMIGGDDDDTYYVDNTGDVVTEVAGQGTDFANVTLTSGTWTLGANLEDATVTSTGAVNLTGNADINILTGNAAANILNGMGGEDTMVGLGGNDTYVVDDVGDVVTEGAAGGTDLIQSSVTYSLSALANVENLTLTGAGDINATGNGTANRLTGNTGDNVLDGGLGSDTMVGGLGDDTYHVDVLTDVVTEAASAGTDEVITGLTYTLGTNVENLTLTGSVDVNGTGNTLANTLTGNDGDNVLNGMAGLDTYAGGEGNDTYVLDQEGELATVTEVDGEGTADQITIAYANTSKTVPKLVSLTGALAEIENLTVTGTGLFNLTGNGEDNVLMGNTSVNTLTGGAGDDTLNGGAGADTMIGGNDDDTYYVDNTGDVVTEVAGQGTDFANVTLTSGTWTLGANLEDATVTSTGAVNLTGNADINILTGNAAANILNGMGGEDTMVGLGGNDTYVVDDVGDVVTEGAAGGTDLIQSSVTYSLSALANVENLTLTGAGDINATGNGTANRLTGNTGDNVLDGGLGSDTMVGGLGDDTYHVDVLTDVVTEAASAGTDEVITGLTYTLGTNVENLTLTGSGDVNGTGNTLANSLTGNDGDNVLNGMAGLDTYAGGEGNDTYVLDQEGELATVTEIDGDGTADQITIAYANTSKTVPKLVSLTGALAEIENLTVTGTGLFNLTGNGEDNVLMGNGSINTLTGGAGDDTLNGGAGADTMIGGDDDDTYYVDNTGDVVTEVAGQGTDFANVTLTSGTWTLGANLEDATVTSTGAVNLTGNADINILTGNAAANILNGMGGEDTMVGLGGNDTYVVDDVGDVVTEGAAGGTDLIQSSVTYSLSALANVENLTLTGAGDINATGNGTANRLTGNTGDNVLDGGLGSDTMVGGLGDDTYHVDVLTDVVTEAASAGTDEVITGLTYTLGTNVENLTLTGSVDVNGTGNTLANTLTGNDGDNVLNGMAGLDTLNGGDGSDTLIGGLDNDSLTGGDGADIFVFNSTLNGTTNVDLINGFVSASDKINLENAIFSSLVTPGALSGENFVSGAGAVALDANDYIVYNSTTGDLYYDADGNGAVAAVKFATLVGAPLLVASDIAVI